MNMSDLIFAPEEPDSEDSPGVVNTPWKILIVDDEPGIHDVTLFSLKDFQFDGCGLTFFSAYSGIEAKQILADEKDIAIALIDVVMEEEHAGLDLVKYIREQINNKIIRIVLRTGQPGQAPERDVISNYDINDYKEKTELTAQKLYSTIFTSLRSYRDLVALERNRKGLEHVIHSSGTVFSQHKLDAFIQGVLEQIVALLYLGDDAFYVGCESFALEQDDGKASVIAGTGRYSELIGRDPQDSVEPSICDLVKQAQQEKRSILREHEFIGYFRPCKDREDVIYVSSRHSLTKADTGFLELFLNNVSIAYENVLLQDEIENTQRDMLYMLGDSIETRSKETGQHVRRVAEYCRLIALGIGLPESVSEVLQVASTLHDFGKIGIPDEILHHPGKLDADQWEVMKRHASIGGDLLKMSERETLKAASVIASQHHEKWDGSGYPQGLKGEAIHLYGRITAVADVFDALGSERCYKEPWAEEEIFDYMEAKRGTQFDPLLIDWILSNRDLMRNVRQQYPD
jgi:response regulator RpfG family c-di-GMP phosphodiesterase